MTDSSEVVIERPIFVSFAEESLKSTQMSPSHNAIGSMLIDITIHRKSLNSSESKIREFKARSFCVVDEVLDEAKGPYFGHMWDKFLSLVSSKVVVDFDVADVWQVPLGSTVEVKGGKFVGHIGSVIFGETEEDMTNYMFLGDGNYVSTTGVRGLTEMAKALRYLHKTANLARNYGALGKTPLNLREFLDGLPSF